MWFLLRLVSTFSSFFTVLSSPHGPPSASFTVLFPRVHLFLLLSRSLFFLLSFSLAAFLESRRPAGVFASVHQKSIHRNYNNNNDKSRNNVLCPREYIDGGPRYGKQRGETKGRRGAVGRSSTCRPGAIVFFFVSDLSPSLGRVSSCDATFRRIVNRR